MDVIMKRVMTAAALVAIIIALPDCALAQTRKQIVAGPIKVTGHAVSGSFRVEAPRRAGIVSTGTGGACLVADPGNRTCRTDDDCGDLRTQYHPAGAAYCLRRNRANKRKTCWVRPGRDLDFCLKSPVVPLPVNTRIDLPQVDPRVMGANKNIRWRVHACLNGYDAATKKDNRACAGGAGMNPSVLTSDGPSRRVQ